MSEQEEKVPTNRELAERVARLAAELGVEIKPAGSKARLLEQLEQLEQQRSAAPSPPAPTMSGAVRADGMRDPSALEQRHDASPSAEGDASLDAGATRHVPPASATGQVSSLDTSGDPPPASTPTTYKVVKAITSKRGILGPGDRITAEDIRGDEASVRESLRALERAGRIVRS